MSKRKKTNREKVARCAKVLLVAMAAVVIVSIVLLLSGCGKNDYEIVHSTSTVQEEGRYHLFRTEEKKEYLRFMEGFDETKYEIIDISTSMNSGVYGSGEFYMVTYRNIESN